MSLFDSASLVVTPNGTKASKLYAIKPTDASGDLSVTRATTATRVNSSGLIESVATNVPRLDYTNSTCPSILVEPQRTNLLSYSEQFDNAYWSKTNMVIVANDTTAPDGSTTADRATASSYPSTSITKTNLLTAASYTSSIYVKANTVSTFRIDLVTAGFALGSNCIFNLTTLATTITNYGSTTGSTAKIQNVGNGWYRCSLTISATAVVYFNQFYPAANGSVYIWGAQLEAGSYATSYIPTVASSVTRNADVISKTGISSLIGQTEGTIFVEEVYDANVANNGGVDDTLVSLSDGTTNNLISIFHYGSGGGVDRKVLFFIRLSNVTQAAYYSSSLPSGTYKIAMAYKNNDVAFYINGVQLSTDTSASIPATSALTLVDPVTVLAATKTVNFKSIALFKTRLSNTELATLTTI